MPGHVSRASRIATLLVACAACAHGDRTTTLPEASPERGEGQPKTATAATNAPPSPSLPMGEEQAKERLASIRTEVERLLTAQAKLLWETWTRGASPDLDASLAGREALFSRETLAFVKDARDSAEGDERRALALLHAFLVGEHLARDAAAGSQAAAGRLGLTWDGRTVPTEHVPRLLALEPDPARRTELERAWADAERRQAGVTDARWRGIAAAAGRIGYGSLLALAVELRGEPTRALGALANSVLGETDAEYRALVDALAHVEMGAGLAQLRGRDMPRLLRAGEDARAFPAGRATGDVGKTLAALGLELARRPGVVLDLEARSGKDPRPLALPVEVPGGVRVSFAPQGGAAELRALLHEMGVATYYAYVATPVLEFRRLGAVTSETWAGLFEDLASDPKWLAEHTGLAESHLAPIVRTAAARRLHQARTLAARVLIEIGRAGKPGGSPAVAKAILERAFARPVEADELELFLLERDPLLESADALRALLLAAQGEAFLAGRSPTSWWGSKESGAWLAAAFAAGSRLAPADLARSFGAARVDASALVASSRARAAAAGISQAAVPQTYGIVQNHHGCIDVEGEPGKGTRFRVRLPVRQPAGMDREGIVRPILRSAAN